MSHVTRATALAALLLLATLPAARAAPAEVDLDLPFPARFFAGPGGDAGFVVSNADGIPFLTAYYRLGGPPVVGPPITHRFVRGDLVTQAFERLVLQWRAPAGVVYLPRSGPDGDPYPVEATVPLPPGSAPTSAINAGVWGPTVRPWPPAAPADSPCAGDEALVFSPPRPVAGQTVQIAATSSRSLVDVRLEGAFAPVLTAVQFGGRGYVWAWSVRVDGPGQYTYDFTADGRPCASRVLTVGGDPPRAPVPY